jgi:hypothetical protein
VEIVRAEEVAASIYTELQIGRSVDGGLEATDGDKRIVDAKCA